MLKKISGNMDFFTKNLKFIFKKNQMETVELKSSITGFKNSKDEFSNRLSIGKEITSKLENLSVKKTQTECEEKQK